MSDRTMGRPTARRLPPFPSPPVLILRTSCHNRASKNLGGVNPSREKGVDNDRREEASIARFLSTLPIACDILTIPEIPDGLKHTPRRVLLNPCGIANVVVKEHDSEAKTVPRMEERQEKNAQNRTSSEGGGSPQDASEPGWPSDSTVLLALSSCSVDASNRKIPASLDYGGGHNVIPLEPNPSTFAFRFGSSHASSSLAKGGSGDELYAEVEVSFMYETHFAGYLGEGGDYHVHGPEKDGEDRTQAFVEAPGVDSISFTNDTKPPTEALKGSRDSVVKTIGNASLEPASQSNEKKIAKNEEKIMLAHFNESNLRGDALHSDLKSNCEASCRCLFVFEEPYLPRKFPKRRTRPTSLLPPPPSQMAFLHSQNGTVGKYRAHLEYQAMMVDYALLVLTCAAFALVICIACTYNEIRKEGEKHQLQEQARSRALAILSGGMHARQHPIQESVPAPLGREVACHPREMGDHPITPPTARRPIYGNHVRSWQSHTIGYTGGLQTTPIMSNLSATREPRSMQRNDLPLMPRPSESHIAAISRVVPTLQLSSEELSGMQDDLAKLSPCSRMGAEWVMRKHARMVTRQGRPRAKIKPPSLQKIKAPHILAKSQTPPKPVDTVNIDRDAVVDAQVTVLGHVAPVAPPSEETTHMETKERCPASVIASSEGPITGEYSIKQGDPPMLPDLCPTPASRGAADDEDSFLDDYW